MNWAQTYQQDNEPTLEDIGRFVDSLLWSEICCFLKDKYSVSPKVEYSRCSMQKGWNVKYRKGGKSLCVLYPMAGYFLALVVVNEKDRMEAELMMSGCCDYVRGLFEKTPYFRGSKWLMIEMRDPATLQDVKDLIALRA